MRHPPLTTALAGVALGSLLALAGCGGDETGSPHGGRPGAGGPGPWGGGTGGETTAAVPVEVTPVVRRSISSYIETNGTLEAEFEVDLVARTDGPVIELNVEEGDAVRKDQILARLDELELRAQLEIARVDLEESRLAYDRARNLQEQSLISSEAYDQARSAFDTAQAQYDGNLIKLGYAEIKAPFDGLIIRRDVDLAQHVRINDSLFRISDFTPLLCPIQVPERELRRLDKGQRGHLTVEAFPGERFEASVLRVSPVVDAATGTIKVTLDVQAKDKLRPGMFARVFLETETRARALVIPKAALSLESIGDTVYVAGEETASRREVELGFSEGDFVEVVSGVSENESVVVVGQDGLSEGTPIKVMQAPSEMARDGEGPGHGGRPGGGFGGGRMDLSKATPEQIERIKGFMRARGMTEEQIEQRLKQARERANAASP